MMTDTLIKLKTGSLATMETKVNNVPVVPLDVGTVYFAVDTTTHIGKLVYDAPIAGGGIDRIVMSANADTAVLANQANRADIATQAVKFTDKRNLDGVLFDGTENVSHYAKCSTAASMVAKLVNCSNYALVTGARITVTFNNTNTADNPTLDVNSTGAKAIYYRGQPIAADALAANHTYEFIYDGTNYVLLGDLDTDTNTTYELASATNDGLMSTAQYNKLLNIVTNVATGNSNKIAYYSSTNAISSGTITTDGSYFGAVNYLSINNAHQTNYRLYVNGTSYLNGDVSLGTIGTPSTYPGIGNKIGWSDGAQIYYQKDSATAGKLLLDLTQTTSDALAIAKSGSAKIFIDPNASTIYPSVNNSGSLGLSGQRWGQVYIGSANSYGSTSQPIYWANGVPTSIDFHVGNSSVGEHDANNITYNMIGHYTSNGPSVEIGAYETNGAIYAQGYNSSKVSQIAQDYTNGNLFVRTKHEDTWQAWKRIVTSSTKSAGSATQPVYMDNDGNLNPTTHTLKAAIEGGIANRIAYYSADNKIEDAPNITTDGSRLSINGNIDTTYHLRVNGKTYFNGDTRTKGTIGIDRSNGSLAVAMGFNENTDSLDFMFDD